MKILNLYAGIGGNRKLWGDEHEITAVEIDPKIAAIYQEFWPNDKVVVGDAHEYLEDHFAEFDFIWSSPPCPSHSACRQAIAAHVDHVKYPDKQRPVYPDMKLYEEIIFLKHYFKGKWCVENVVSYYEPLITPQKSASHYFWTNFLIPSLKDSSREHDGGIQKLQERKGFDLSKYKGIDKRKTLRNCVEPEVARQILDYAINPVELQSSIL